MATLETRRTPEYAASPRRSAPRKDSREELLRAAKALFAREGFEGVSVKEIAEKAGVNVGLIAYYFGGKAGMYKECLTENGEQRLAATRRVLALANSLLEFELRLKLFSEEIVNSHLRDPELAAIVHRECERGGSQLPEVADIFRTTYLLVFKTLQLFIEDGISKKFLRQDLDAEIATLFFFGQLIHAVRLDTANSKYFGKTIANPEYRERYLSQLVEIFILGLAQKGASS